MTCKKNELQTKQTPVPIAGSVEEACVMLDTKKMNAVVNERSTEDEVDINARLENVLRNLVGQLNKRSSTDHLRTERVDVKTGNAEVSRHAEVCTTATPSTHRRCSSYRDRRRGQRYVTTH